MRTLEHPAIVAAVDALAGSDSGLTPITAIVLDDIAAVVVDGDMGRWIVFAHPDNGNWLVSGTTYGAPRPDGPRSDRTGAPQPIQRLGTRYRAQPGALPGWFAVIGRAARDAASVVVTSTLDTSVEPVGADGLVFAVVRATNSDDPTVTVITRDGQRVDARPLAA